MSTEIAKEPQAGLLSQVQHYWHILLKWKWTAVLFFLAVVGAVAIYTLTATPVYTANGTLWVEDDPNILPFEDVQAIASGSSLGSQARLLQSRALASDTIDKLKLYENPDFAGKPKKGEPLPDPADPIIRERLVQRFLKKVSVSAKERTQLVDVSFSSRNPKLATDVLNALFDGYIELLVKKRYTASEQATEFLNTQIAELRTEIDKQERALNQYGSERDILPLSTAEAPSVARIGEVNSALTAATLDRVNKYNTYNQLQSAPLGEIPNAPVGSLIQSLREQYITLSRDYATRLTTVRPEFPAMQRLKSRARRGHGSAQERDPEPHPDRLQRIPDRSHQGAIPAGSVEHPEERSLQSQQQFGRLQQHEDRAREPEIPARSPVQAPERDGCLIEAQGIGIAQRLGRRQGGLSAQADIPE